MNKFKKRWSVYNLPLSVHCLVVFLFMSVIVSGKDIYVNNQSGADSNSGLSKSNPFRTIQKAVATVNPGDVIHLSNTGLPYKETLFFSKQKGTAEARITVEGNGATLSGSEMLDITEWEQVSPGLYKNSVLYTARRFNKDVINRYFFLFDGKINRMGRTLKGLNAPLKKPAELGENEWTFVDGENAFYLKIDTKKKLVDCLIEYPVRSTGVQISDSASFITIKNMTSTHFYNDGFGITGNTRKLKFENIQALYCGDDGISAHANCEYEVDGLISIGNGTGICDTGNSNTSYNRVFIRDCLGVDIYFLNEKVEGGANHFISNSIILGNAAKPLLLNTEKPKGELSVTMDNVLFIGKADADVNMRVYGNTEWTVRNCTFEGLNLVLKTKRTSIANSIVSGKKNNISKLAGTDWHGKENLYNLHFISIAGKYFSIADKNIEEYKHLTLDDKSVWTSGFLAAAEKTTGIKTAGFNREKVFQKNDRMKQFFQEGISSLK